MFKKIIDKQNLFRFYKKKKLGVWWFIIENDGKLVTATNYKYYAFKRWANILETFSDKDCEVGAWQLDEWARMVK